jgi:hypothetical protein
MMRILRATALLPVVVFAASVVASGQTPSRPALGRVSFFSNASSTATGSDTRTLSELIGTATFESPDGEQVDYEYRLDVRFAGYPNASDRRRRASIYDAYVGLKFRRGTMRARVGQMWLNELGGLGAVAGGLFELGQPQRDKRGRWRAAVFGGLEPKVLEAGYESGVAKVGGFAAYEGVGLRRHVLGLVSVRTGGMTERSVLVANNLLPVGKRLFIYQAAEYDVKSAGVSAPGSLTYFFGNARYTANRFLEVQGSYHRGRSIDSRTIVRDQLDGRAIDPRLLDGLRFESANSRVTVTIIPGLRAYAGYGRDRNNHDESASSRYTYGMFYANVLGSGIDVTASDSRMERPGGTSYNSWYVSLGRSFTPRLYLSGDYGSSLSIFRFVTSSGFLIETRPRTRRFALSGVLNTGVGPSVLVTFERLGDDDSTQTRLMSGVTYRF